MKNRLYIPFFLVVFNFYNCKNQAKNDIEIKPEPISESSKEVVENNNFNNDSILMSKIFKDDVVPVDGRNNDSLILFNKYHFKAHSLDTESKILLKFKECTELKDTIELNKKFKHLKTNNWFEEALLIKNSYYELNNYIIIVDYIKNNINSCPNFNKSTYIIEQIRIYESQKYFEIASKSNSILFDLKSTNKF
ncbi:MAG: hypothetical protein H2058_09795 [Muricauda sp.]|nr:hypothetical protein [Allomuricauda sp.]MBA4745542.1 hypothetical protein [Allomuricauda sp.]